MRRRCAADETPRSRRASRRRNELDRLAGDGLAGQRRSAARVRVELGEDHTVQFEPLVKGLGGIDGVLAGHRVEHQVNLVGLRRVGDLRNLVHERVVDRQPARGVEDDNVAIELAGFAHGVATNNDGVLMIALGVHGHIELPAEHFDLVDGRRPLEVGRNQQRLLAAQSCNSGPTWRRLWSLPEALQAGHEDYRRRLGDRRGCVSRRGP